MGTYRLVIIHWSSLILLQLFWIYNRSGHCASVYSNLETSEGMTSVVADSVSLSAITTTTKSLPSASILSTSSSSSTTSSFHLPIIESLCSHQIERHFQSDGKESSLIFELQPDLLTNESCKRILIAPESHGFFIRLMRSTTTNSNNKKLQNQSGTTTISLKKNHRGITQKIINSTYTCPLRIFSANDLLTPWRIDPCQFELNNDIDEPVRLLPGRLKIIWDHNDINPTSRLMITVLGKGSPCFQPNKHPCLRFGFDILFCISKYLICDGIRHCPNGNEYDSDEDYELCSKRKKLFNDDIDKEILENLKIEIFRYLFNVETSSSSSSSGTAVSSSSSSSGLETIITSTMKIDKDGGNNNGFGGKEFNNNNNNNKNYHDNLKNLTRASTITGDLSKYGPWGYLMLGMLLCGGALLVCGLWECCCRQNKTNDTTISGSTLANSTVGQTSEGLSTNNELSHDISPPNYDEIDPPPAYSALFPNQFKSLSVRSSEASRSNININTNTNTNNINTNPNNNDNNDNNNDNESSDRPITTNNI